MQWYSLGLMATVAVIVGVLFTALGVSALVGLVAAKLYDWISSRDEHRPA